MEFREAAAGAIPFLSEWLADEDEYVRHTAAETIGQFANHGE